MRYELTAGQFRAALKEGAILGLKCRTCRGYTAPPRKVCSTCGSEDVEAVEFSGAGEIKTFTVVHVPPEGYEAPFTVVMVELDEGPWLAGNLVGIDPAQVGMEVIGRRVVFAGCREIAPDLISGGERIAMTFRLA